MTNEATNGLDVYGNGVIGSNTQASYSWQVGKYSGAQLATPRYTQMMYRSGTDAASGGTYPLTITVNNNGAPAVMYELEFVMPPTVDPNILTPKVPIVSAIVNGVNETANWTIYNQNGSNGATGDATLGPSAFALVATAKAGGIPIGKSATFILNMPILLSAFPFQEIGATGDYRDVHGYARAPRRSTRSGRQTC